MSENLKKIFELITKSENPNTTCLVDSKDMLRWIPIVICWEPNKSMGIAEDGNWVVEVSLGLVKLSTPDSFIKVKILLEKPLHEIYHEVTNNFEQYKIKDCGTELFPDTEIINAAMEDNSEYWIELAFKWYEELHITKKIMIKESMVKIVENKNLPQKLRHTAIKEIATLKKL